MSHNNAGEGNHVETVLNGKRLHLSHKTGINALGWRRHFTTVLKNVPKDSTLQVKVDCNPTTQTYCWHQPVKILQRTFLD